MTKHEARMYLGVSNSDSNKRIVQTYQNQCQTLQSKMIPGNSCTDRQKAQAELVNLTAAWNTLEIKPSTKKEFQPLTSINRVDSIPSSNKAYDLADSWEQVFEVIPYAKPILLFFVIAIIIGCLIIYFS